MLFVLAEGVAGALVAGRRMEGASTDVAEISGEGGAANVLFASGDGRAGEYACPLAGETGTARSVGSAGYNPVVFELRSAAGESSVRGASGRSGWNGLNFGGLG
jgi:hypothetical protein